jgi:hypothetical protein
MEFLLFADHFKRRMLTENSAMEQGNVPHSLRKMTYIVIGL